jgi:hypothetical protein
MERTNVFSADSLVVLSTFTALFFFMGLVVLNGQMAKTLVFRDSQPISRKKTLVHFLKMTW